MSTKPIQWHEECLRNAQDYNRRKRHAAEEAGIECDKLFDQKLRLYAAQIERAKKEGRKEFDRERFKVPPIESATVIGLRIGTATEDGGCNACGRMARSGEDYQISEVRLRGMAFRICETCKPILTSLLRGEPPTESRTV